MPITRKRAALSCAAAMLTAVAVMSPAQAAEEFKFSAAQIQSLDVRLLRLDQPVASVGPIYPARVVLPPSQEQVSSAPLSGTVDQLLVAENQAVKAGQPLLRLVSPEFGELQLRLAEAASKARLSQKTLARERTLLADGIVPERRVAEAEAAAGEDRARQAQAEAALRLAGADEALIRRVAEGGPLQDALAVRARSAGVITRLEVKLGQRVQSAEPLARLVDTRRLWLEVQLPADRHASSLTVGGMITAPERDISARVLSIAPQLAENQTLALRAEVVRGGPGLRVGEALQVRVPLAGQQGWSLPQAAVVRHEGKSYVFVRSAQGFVATPVELQSGGGEQLLVVSPALKSGQQLAIGSVVALKAAWLGKGGGE